MKKIKNILKLAMRLEEQGGKFYSYYAEQMEDPHHRDVFEKLAIIEQEHYHFLKKKYDALFFAKELHDISWVIDTQYITPPPIFGDTAIHFNETAVDYSFSDLAILRMAYVIEDDFSNFYKTAAEYVTDQEVKDFLIALSQWEEEHKDLFYVFYQRQLKDSWGNFEKMFKG